MHTAQDHIFKGNIFLFHAFDVGDDINLEEIRRSGLIVTKPMTLSAYFKNYHIPLLVELPGQLTSCVSIKLHSFGVISLNYKIPFNASLEQLARDINKIDEQYQEQSVQDAQVIFKIIKSYIKQAKFFHLKNDYPVLQVDPEPNTIDIITLKKNYGGIIVSAIRHEKSYLSEYQKNEILDSALGYYHGDLIVIDTEGAFVYDTEYEEILEFFEFANIQQLELQYFDRVLDHKLNAIYERKVSHLSIKAYLPFFGTRINDPVAELSRLQVDISVITERLESSIKLTGQAYYAQMYELLVAKMDLSRWQESIDKKLKIIQNVSMVYQNKIDAIREDLLSVLIIILIFIELVIGILEYLK